MAAEKKGTPAPVPKPTTAPAPTKLTTPTTTPTPTLVGPPPKKSEQVERLNRASWLNDLCNMKFEQLTLRLREEFSALPGRPDATEAATFLTNLNKEKNRYIDIPCLDKTRVKLQQQQQQKTDYIHANWVECPELNIKIIMCQAPINITVEDFYHMLYQEQVTAIACLTRLVENEVEKSYAYWPLAEKGQLVFGKYTMKALSSHEESYCRITGLELTMKDSKECHKITHILYTDWMDHRAPNCTHRFLELVNLCTRKFSELKPNNKPATIVIHCSAGIGRSGTLAALLRLQKAIENGKAPNIPLVVQQLRQQRALAVQAIEQYIFIYRAVMEMIYKLETRPTQAAEELLKHINALRSMTTRSTCNLQLELVKHPRGGYTFFPGISEEAKRLSSLAHQELKIIKQQTAAKAAKLKSSIIDLKKRLSARLLSPKSNRSRSPASTVIKAKTDNKGPSKQETPAKPSMTVEAPIPRLSTPMENFEQRINTAAPQAKKAGQAGSPVQTKKTGQAPTPTKK